MKFTPTTAATFLFLIAGQQQVIDAAQTLIDFSEFSAGDFVTGLGGGVQVTVSPLPGNDGSGGCFTGGPKGNAPMIFDSSNPTGGDDDLGSPHQDFGGPGKGQGGRDGAAGENRKALGNLLIISEDCDTNDPDDTSEGGVFTFTFRSPKPLKSIGLFDFEQGAYISAKISDGSVYESGFLNGVGNNGFKDIELNVEKVDELTVTCDACAIAYLAFQPPDAVGAFGDPHFMTWDGDVYEYMGECDLVLLENPSFDGGDGMSIHLRTRIMGKLSVIKNAVLAIGSDTLEVEAGGSLTWSNGVANAVIPTSIGGYPISYRSEVVNRGTMHVFKVDLGHDDSVTLKTFDYMVDVCVKTLQNRLSRFGDSVGMVGDPETGAWLGRNGVTEFTSESAFASEWQVKYGPSLFRLTEAPQYPDACILPDDLAESRRQLLRGESGKNVDMRDAQIACSRATLNVDDYESCLSDVLSVGDLGMATHFQ